MSDFYKYGRTPTLLEYVQETMPEVLEIPDAPFEISQELQARMDAYTVMLQKRAVWQAVENAIAFGKDIISDFITENVILGITEAGKTGHVRRVLTDVMIAIQTGAFSDAIDELDAIAAEDKDPVFISQARINAMKAKLQAYLDNA